MKIGIICPSEIALRRFLPALKLYDKFEFAGVAVADNSEWNGMLTEEMRNNEIKKAENFGGKIYSSYSEMINSNEIDAVYLPLPPALHYKWGKKVLEAGKHLFLEKPSTISAETTKELIQIAEKKGLALHENYMFQFHSQIDFIRNEIAKGTIGDVRLYRIAFGFPFRGTNDFRYNKELGGGALLDCGGYTVKLANILLGDTAKIYAPKLNYRDDLDVDIYGSATMINDDGVTAQLSFGMDNSYKCELEVWGSTGTIFTNRILTAPVGFEPTVTIKNADGEKNITLPADDSFKKSIEKFAECIENENVRRKNYSEILKQSEFIDKFERI